MCAGELPIFSVSVSVLLTFIFSSGTCSQSFPFVLARFVLTENVDLSPQKGPGHGGATKSEMAVT